MTYVYWKQMAPLKGNYSGTLRPQMSTCWYKNRRHLACPEKSRVAGELGLPKLMPKSKHTLIYQISFPVRAWSSSVASPTLCCTSLVSSPVGQASSCGQRQGCQGLNCPLERRWGGRERCQAWAGAECRVHGKNKRRKIAPTDSLEATPL